MDRAPEDRIQFVAIGRSVSVLEITTNPHLAHLMTEDACWRFGYEHWQVIRPSRRDREQWRRWQDEGDRLRDKRARIEQLARELGLPPVAALPWHRRVLRKLRRERSSGLRASRGSRRRREPR